MSNLSIKTFEQFSLINEGGGAIKSSRRIRESEVPLTLEYIKRNLIPLLGIDDDDFIIIGSIGKKKNPTDTSGDIDLGISAKALSKSLGTSSDLRSVGSSLNTKVMENLPIGLDESPDVNYLKGLNIVSLGWPIEGDFKNGVVQLDLIPISDIEWAKFIYYSPDYRKNESNYKSAHRNWLFSAILATRKKVLSTDDNDEIMTYKTPVLVLSDGLYNHTKSYEGKLKNRLSKSKKIEGSEEFITNDPLEFIKFTMGKSYPIEKVKTFEDVLKIVNSPDFDLSDKVEDIKDQFIQFMERSGLEMPSEIK